jgi:hypothetical protein
MKTITVALNRPKGDLESIAHAKHIVTCMEGNPYFPSPPVPTGTLLLHIADAEAAQVVALSRLHGAAADRDAKLTIVYGDLEQRRSYVQTVARSHGGDAEAVVVSSGMSTKQSAGPRKQLFAVKQLAKSGSVRLEVRDPGIESSFDWQWSTDGVHWVDAGETTYTYLVIKNLTPGTEYFFRHRTLTRDGLSDWSDPIKLRVV